MLRLCDTARFFVRHVDLVLVVCAREVRRQFSLERIRITSPDREPPVPQRPTSWQTFLRAHWGAIAGADFFTTEVWTWRGLVTYYTVFVIDLASRRV
jgi:hypothetical protein